MTQPVTYWDYLRLLPLLDLQGGLADSADAPTEDELMGEVGKHVWSHIASPHPPSRSCSSSRRTPSAKSHRRRRQGEPVSENFGWYLGYGITIAVVLVVVALVVPILVLAYSIGNEAKMINDSLTTSVHNTAALNGLNTTIDHAEVIVAGLERGRTRLGG